MTNWTRYIRLFIFGLMLALIQPAYGQPRDNDTKLAGHYFTKGQFEKAEIYYEKSFKKYDSQLYFDRYFLCLFYQEKFSEAEKLALKRIKRDPYTIGNQFKLADVYKETDREVEADKIYEELIQDVKPIQSRVDKLGETFQNKGMYDCALQTFLRGRKIMKKGYGFQLELASLYSLLNRPSDMIEEYLNLLDYSPVYVRTVQTYLSRVVDFETDTELVEMLREEILLKVQKNPDQEVYNEMFIWYYLQKKEFTGAVIQAKALDKKKDENGRRVLEIGHVCQANGAYRQAMKAYQYVIDLGSKYPNYHIAVQSKLSAEFEELTQRKSFTNEEIVEVAQDFEAALVDMGKSPRSLGVMEQLARIYAFHLNDTDKAMNLVNESLELPVNKSDVARLKIIKGDIYVVSNDIWEASLLYMQVEKANSEDIIGHEAKFKNAKVFYYDGEFDYAKAQLDVLKASTSKLIANDAMQLSLLLQDNLSVDTAKAPVQLYANADLLLTQNKFDEAIAILDSLERGYPFHSMVDEVLFKKAEIYEGQQKWTQAVELYVVVVESYAHDILGDDAAMRLARIYETRLDNREKAAEYYKMILFEFSGSLYTAEAREKYRNIVAEFN